VKEKRFKKIASAAAFALFLVLPGGALAAPTCEQNFQTAGAYHSTTKAARGFAFDIDDNVLYLPTKIMLFNKKTGEQVGISTSKFAEVRSTVGLSGEFKDFELRGSTKDGSLRFFGDESDPNQNNILNDLKSAIANNQPSVWQGPAWNAFVRAMSSPVTAAQSSFITARLHSPATIREAFLFLQKAGYIQNVPRLENIFPVSYPKFAPRFSNIATGAASAADPSALKAEVMKGLLDEIQARTVEDGAPLVVNQDGDGSSPLHTWGFSDDDRGNYTTAIKVLSAEVAKGRWPNVKITIFYTGKNTAEPPEQVVIKNDGSLRTRKANELFFSP
jgi:hypothetical protein